MKHIKAIIISLFISSFIIVGLSDAQPTIPKENIPTNIDVAIKTNIERLYSSNKEEREKASKILFEMLLLKQKIAEPAAPFLIDNFIEDLSHGDRNALGNLAILHSYRGYSIDERAVVPLINALKDSDMNTRMNAAGALGGTKDSRAVKPLINVLNDVLENTKSNAAKSLTQITGKDFGTDQKKWTQWWEQNKGNLQTTKKTSSKEDNRSLQRNAILPPFDLTLMGKNEIRIKNPNSFEVTVGIRSENRGKDFGVPVNGVSSVFVQNGKYEIYFVYSDKPDALFRGDDFTLNDNGVEIKIVKVVDGNYGIRQVK